VYNLLYVRIWKLVLGQNIAKCTLDVSLQWMKHLVLVSFWIILCTMEVSENDDDFSQLLLPTQSISIVVEMDEAIPVMSRLVIKCLYNVKL
jgi:hypothetical protein